MAEEGFADRVAIVTGAGRGFGKAFSQALADRGAHAVVVDIDAEAAESAAADIRGTGGDALALPCDVSDEEKVGALVAEVTDRFGGIDILINNAGLHSFEYNQPMAVLGIERIRRLFDVNVMGTIICTLAARPSMLGRPGACVFNIASSASYTNITSYGVSKLAVRGLTISLARELGPDGIRVNAVAPGLHLTDTIRAELPAQQLTDTKAKQILDRFGEESDIVDAMLFLCSDKARFITGETLRVSGGYTLSIG